MAHLPQQIISERIDDVVLLLEVMKKMGLPEILNQHLPRHWKQEGLDWGWVACIWLSYIISQGDHRKVRLFCLLPEPSRLASNKTRSHCGSGS
jgi:transposase